jgi:hypothetical protein
VCMTIGRNVILRAKSHPPLQKHLHASIIEEHWVNLVRTYFPWLLFVVECESFEEEHVCIDTKHKHIYIKKIRTLNKMLNCLLKRFQIVHISTSKIFEIRTS